MARRRLSVFSLSFLDIMSCGFGAVVLFFMIISHQTRVRSDEVNAIKLAEVTHLELETDAGRKNLAIILNSLEELKKELVETQGRSRRVIETLNISKEELAVFEKETLALKDHINKLKADIKSTEEGLRRLRAEAKDQPAGPIPKQFVGPGDRQYVTGLRLGGRRVAVMLDASASMLADTIVNVIRRRNMDLEDKLASEKWRRAVKAAQWVVSELPEDSRFQVIVFNTGASVLMPDTRGRWLETTDEAFMEEVYAKLEEVVPEGGTSLYNAFASLDQFREPPDNIIILTDGLPTQAKRTPVRRTVSARQRLSYFNDAVELLYQGVPVSTIMFPMEGDPAASASYWQLAALTGGSMLSPARDWP